MHWCMIRYSFLFAIILAFGSCRDNPVANKDLDFRLTDFEPSWSPDGRTIAYVHGDTVNGKTGIYLINVDGTDNRIIYSSASAYSPDWSPDGKWIAFSDNAQIFKVKLNGDSLAQLTADGRNFLPAWSPDGRWITYNESICEGPNTCGVWLMSATGNGRLFITAFGNYPSWSPMRNQIMYLTTSITSEGQTIGDSLWLFDVDKGSRKVLIPLEGTNWDNRYPKYSPDGTMIVFTSQASGQAPNIWVMDSSGNNLKQLTQTGGYSCDWSPDGEWIAYTDTRSVNGKIWLMRKDGSDKHQLTF